MKIKNILFCCGFLLSISCSSQNHAFEGTWNLYNDNITTVNKLPKDLTLYILKDSLIVVPNKRDTLNYTRVEKFDSKSVLLKNISIDNDDKTFIAYSYILKLNKDGDKLSVELKTDDKNKSYIAEYAFQTECCSNHTPLDCADNAKDLQKLKHGGCTGFHRPK